VPDRPRLKRKHLIVLACVGFLLGVFAGTVVDTAWLRLLPLVAIGALPFARWRLAALVCALAFTAGLVRIGLEPRAAQPGDIGSFAAPREARLQAEVTGWIMRYPDRRFDRTKYLLQQRPCASAKQRPGTPRVDCSSNYRRIGPCLWRARAAAGRLEIPFESAEFSYKTTSRASMSMR